MQSIHHYRRNITIKRLVREIQSLEEYLENDTLHEYTVRTLTDLKKQYEEQLQHLIGE
jgi:nicotinic acid mononucleotide adenylyltransferase